MAAPGTVAAMSCTLLVRATSWHLQLQQPPRPPTQAPFQAALKTRLGVNTQVDELLHQHTKPLVD